MVNDCKTVYQTLNEKEGKLTIEIKREKTSLNETFEVLVQNIETSDVYVKSYLENRQSGLKTLNLSIAKPNKDFEPLSLRIKFLPGEILKLFHVNILSSVLKGSKIFTIQTQPVIIPSNKLNLSKCDYVNPDIINVVIEDQNEDASITVGFNQTHIFVNETNKFIQVPIIRTGDLSKQFSLICYTRQQTAIEDKDYIGRGSFEQSRIYFESGDKVPFERQINQF